MDSPFENMQIGLGSELKLLLFKTAGEEPKMIELDKSTIHAKDMLFMP